MGAQRLQEAVALAQGLSACGAGGRRGGGWEQQARVPQPRAPSPQPPEEDAAIVGAVRLLSVLIAALTMDLAGRKALLYVSGGSRPRPLLLLLLPPLEAGAM